jgi:FMN phosphatase YigB (HAD superfamily)
MINWVFDLDLTLYELNGNNFSYKNIIKPENLRQNLKLLKGRKVLFTNGNLDHSVACIHLLNLKNVFHKILCRELTGFKPSINSYIKAYHFSGMKQGESTFFFEDMVVNLEMSKKFNWTTVLIKKSPSENELNNKKVDYHFKDINSALDYFNSINDNNENNSIK